MHLQTSWLNQGHRNAGGVLSTSTELMALICSLLPWHQSVRCAFGRCFFFVLVGFLTTVGTAHVALAGPSYRSPINLAFSPDGSQLAVADPTWGGLVIIDPNKRIVLHEVPLQGDPSHVVWNGNDRIFVSEGKTGTISEVSADGLFSRRLTAVKRAAGVALTSDRKTLLVCDRGLNLVATVDVGNWAVTGQIEVVREPGYIALTSDDQYAIVSNKLPRSEDARLPEHGAEVSVIELASGTARHVRLPGGSSIVRQIAISPDNRWAYVVHQLGRANTMVTQLDRGWVMTNATSIIDIVDASLYTSFLFDKVGSGAANPWGVAVSPDGSKLWATLSGISELATVDLKGLHQLLSGDDVTRGKLQRDLGTMSDNDLLQRRPLSDVEGTRGVALSPDGKTLAVAAYFEGKVLLVDVASEQAIAVPLGTNPTEDQVRKGERLYNSGKNCYQNWLSCATCHEGGRMDALNWDLLNDGQGNPKNARSHVLSAVTPPTNITGCRENALVSARAGYKNIEFQEASETDIVAPTYAYIQSITPEASPYLGPDGRLTPDAVEGKKIFESSAVGCSGCHQPPLFTDKQYHDVGTRILSQDIGKWDESGYDTPTLVEVWRTAPYLHLGHAVTVKDVFTTFNPNDRHGRTSQLSLQQLDQLAAYVMQIGPTAEEGTSSADAGADSSNGNTDPTDSADGKTQGGCICHIGMAPGAPARGSAHWMIAIAGALLMFTAKRGMARLAAQAKRQRRTPKSTQ
jgi:DNA-binding beta-propeller fold protein YncE